MPHLAVRSRLAAVNFEADLGRTSAPSFTGSANAPTRRETFDQGSKMEKIVTNTTPNSLTHFTGQYSLTMSSREIAELVESRHDNVKRTIETLAFKGVIAFPQTEEKPTAGRPAIEYRLDKRSSLIVVAQLCPEFTARIVDRWQELEGQTGQQPANLSRMDILRLAMESEEARIKAEAERDEALRTKHLIGSKREATAMATAAAAKREAESLKARLGESIKAATVKAVENLAKEKFSWRPLMRWCDDNEIPVGKVPDEQYGQVNAYPAEAWQAVHGISLKALFSKAGL